MPTTPARYTIDAESWPPTSVGRRRLRGAVNDRNTARSRARGAESFDVLCECGLAGCAERFAVATDAYDEARRADGILVRRGHPLDGARVVAEGDGYLVAEQPDER